MFERLPPSKRFFGKIILFIIAILGSFFFISDKIDTFRSKSYVIFFDRSVNSLKVGNSVQYKGVPIGVVDSIKVALPYASRVAVVVKISRNMPIYDNFVAKIGMQGLTGSSIIELQGTGKNGKQLSGDLPAIRSEYSMIEQVFDNMPHLITNANKLMKIAHDILSKNGDNLGLIISNLSKALESFNVACNDISESAKVLNSLGKGINTQVMPNIIRASADLAQLMDHWNRDWSMFSSATMPQIMDLVNNLNNMASNINEMLQSERSYFGYLLGLS